MGGVHCTTSASVAGIHRFPKKVEWKIKDFKFSSEDPVLIFDFLSLLVEEADQFDMEEGQPMVYILHMLTKSADLEYEST